MHEQKTDDAYTTEQTTVKVPATHDTATALTLDVTPALPPEASDASDLTGGPSNHHATAGRKGGERMRELIRLGRLYEQEHGLMIGRERLRQLVKFGRQYEADKGLAPKRTRVRRQSPRQSVRLLLQALVRIAKPSHRAELQRALAALDGHRPGPDAAAMPRDAHVAA